MVRVDGNGRVGAEVAILFECTDNGEKFFLAYGVVRFSALKLTGKTVDDLVGLGQNSTNTDIRSVSLK